MRSVPNTQHKTHFFDVYQTPKLLCSAEQNEQILSTVAQALPEHSSNYRRVASHGQPTAIKPPKRKANYVTSDERTKRACHSGLRPAHSQVDQTQSTIQTTDPLDDTSISSSVEINAPHADQAPKSSNVPVPSHAAHDESNAAFRAIEVRYKGSVTSRPRSEQLIIHDYNRWMVFHQKVEELFDLQLDGDTHQLYINLCDEQYYIEPNQGPQLLLAEVWNRYALLDDTERLKVHAVVRELH